VSDIEREREAFVTHEIRPRAELLGGGTAEWDGSWTEQCNAEHGRPLTHDEHRTGWRVTQCDQHGEQRYAVGWRLAEQRRQADEQREREMAACPYVRCECGHHEE
jgi:hypothetical protein